ncbi:MAG: phosphate starvation-inducible protein PhoH [Chitinophagaceae bacterium]|nr:phosphate starvation-inducible protein PhoH [Chitinophagaceae bacterium]
MIEKVFTLEAISPLDFLGAENVNLKVIEEIFPNARIVARGNQVKVIASAIEIERFTDLFNVLLEHYARYGALTADYIKYYTKEQKLSPDDPSGTDVILFGHRGNVIKAKSANQAKLVQTIQEHDLAFVIGPAGTGKTYISVALAVRALKHKEVKKIIITRPAVEAGENLGFLPGDLKEKIDPYLRPIYDALDDMLPPEKQKYYYENRIIEIAPLAYMRGRTLHNAFILLDEAQNTTPMQMKMFLTRMGANSKMIVTGDRSQIDLPKSQRSGLIDAIDTLKKIKEIGVIELTKTDVMRHKLVGKIIGAYEKKATENNEK